MAGGYRTLYELHHRHEMPDKFNHRYVGEYTCSELKQLIKYFDQKATFKKSPVKLDLCKQLYGLTRSKLTSQQRAAVEAIKPRMVELTTDSFWRDSDARLATATAQAQRKFSKRKRDDETDASPEPKRRELRTIAELTPVIQEISQNSTPTASRTCIACLDSDLTNAHFTELLPDTNCMHINEVCSECFTAHVDNTIDDPEENSICCPNSHVCNASLTYEQVHQHASPEVFERYDRKLAGALVSTEDSGYFSCPTEGCPGVGWEENTDAGLAKCLDCSTRICIECGEVAHDGACAGRPAVKRENAIKNNPALARQEAKSMFKLETKTKICSSKDCNTRIFRYKGCAHITCKA